MDEPTPNGGSWITLYIGKGVALGLIEDDLTRRGLTVVRTHLEGMSDYSPAVGVLGTQNLTLYRLAVPADQYAARREEIEAAVALARGSDSEPEAAAEAEEEYDVRGCPCCGRFFLQNYDLCPVDGAALLPAVECLEAGQSGPEYVVAADRSRPDAEALARRLQEVGFNARVESAGGHDRSLVELPWREWLDRTEQAASILELD